MNSHLISISKREKEVLMLLSQGLTLKEVADKLYLSHHTIISHKRNITKKLEAKTNFQLGIIAERLGFLLEHK